MISNLPAEHFSFLVTPSSFLENYYHRMSFDHVVEVMKRTGHDLPSLYKETSEGGLALEYDE